MSQLGRWLTQAQRAATRAIPAGTWAASQPGKLTRPHTVSQIEYVVPQSVDLGPNGNAPFVKFTAAGGATAQVGPQGVGETWSLDQCFVSTSVGQLDAAQAIVYVGPAAIPAYAVTGSIIGGGSQFGLGGVGLKPGDFVFAVWTGGTSGATAYLKVTGTRTALVLP